MLVKCRESVREARTHTTDWGRNLNVLSKDLKLWEIALRAFGSRNVGDLDSEKSNQTDLVLVSFSRQKHFFSLFCRRLTYCLRSILFDDSAIYSVKTFLQWIKLLIMKLSGSTLRLWIAEGWQLVTHILHSKYSSNSRMRSTLGRIVAAPVSYSKHQKRLLPPGFLMTHPCSSRSTMWCKSVIRFVFSFSYTDFQSSNSRANFQYGC